MRLAKQTGRLLEADQILDQLTGPQLARLAAFDRLEGIDDRERWRRLEAVLAIGFSTLANLQIVKGEKTKPNDFIPPAAYRIERPAPEKPASIASQKAFLRHVVALHHRSQ